MSTFHKSTRNPDTGKWEIAIWLDDHFGSHHYGVQFPDGNIHDARERALETREREEGEVCKIKDCYCQTKAACLCLPPCADGGEKHKKEVNKAYDDMNDITEIGIERAYCHDCDQTTYGIQKCMRCNKEKPSVPQGIIEKVYDDWMCARDRTHDGQIRLVLDSIEEVLNAVLDNTHVKYSLDTIHDIIKDIQRIRKKIK
jgi:hypothetical protein